jgi:AcrR family transcriptional regulator
VRKWRATRRAIQVAAIEAVEEHGLSGATVAMITEAAEVAPRTFFNHFATKDAALLGEEWRPLEAGCIAEFVASRRPIMQDLGALLTTVVNTDGLERDLVARRLALAARHPELGGRRSAWIAELEQDLRVVVADRIAAEYPAAEPLRREAATRLLAAVAVVTFRSAWAWWAERGSSESLMGDIAETFSLLDVPRLEL